MRSIDKCEKVKPKYIDEIWHKLWMLGLFFNRQSLVTNLIVA